ncbi:hypothetical protein ACIQTZ_21790 [Paenarthrobacter sp. NPDC090520]|uniref:hypothetical protein n=1 Tax=Paenarthrobacter sp. NPDC090520 TaxID=3364382 RepID=UPI0038254936
MAGDEMDYEALAQRLSDPDTEVQGIGTALHGADAAAAGRSFLLREFGSDEAIEAALRPGRPKVGQRQSAGPSPTVRGRISEQEYQAFNDLIRETGKGQSALVREAVHLLLQRHHKIAS